MENEVFYKKPILELKEGDEISIRWRNKFRPFALITGIQIWHDGVRKHGISNMTLDMIGKKSRKVVFDVLFLSKSIQPYDEFPQLKELPFHITDPKVLFLDRTNYSKFVDLNGETNFVGHLHGTLNRSDLAATVWTRKES